MNTPEQLPEASSLKDAGRKIREIITYLRSLRLTAGQGIRLDHYAAGTTISLSHAPAPTGKSSANEYTGGFRLVDMSETVKEEDDKGNEVEKVIPKLGVLGINTEDNEMGMLYYSVGGIISSSKGMLFDLSKASTNVVLHVYACWNGTTGSVMITTKDGFSELSTKYAAHVLVHIGTFKVTSTGVEDIKQLFYGSEVSFHYMQPYLANIGSGSPGMGYDATLTAYPTPDNPKESTRRGRVFLSVESVGTSNNTPEGFITVHPVSALVLEGTSEENES